MKLDKTCLLQQLGIVLSFVKRYRFLLAFIVFASLYGYIITQVNSITTSQPSEAKIQAQATASPKTRVDEELVTQIEKLEDQNVQIKTIFNEVRKNPFSED